MEVGTERAAMVSSGWGMVGGVCAMGKSTRRRSEGVEGWG